MRYRAGIVTDEMMTIPKLPFLIIGILEALGVASGMSSGGMETTNFETLKSNGRVLNYKMAAEINLFFII